MALAPPPWCVHANMKVGKALPRGSVVHTSHVLYIGKVRCVPQFETVLPTLLEDGHVIPNLCAVTLQSCPIMST